ncbi:DsbA family protein [Candidatus Falkowbacteria bacterium]|nr:MAG: DsbA family protein [Candidatus Falkowbacteria bacterium]
MPKDIITHHSGHRLRNIILSLVIIPISLFVTLLIVGFVADILIRSQKIQNNDYSFTVPSTNQTANTQTYDEKTRKLIEGENNPSFGATNPKVTIVEFSDFACPFCKASFPAIREIGLKNQENVKIIFRDWPGHEFSLSLALAAYCAGEQGKFWEMHDKLFQNQSETFGADKNQLATLAQQLGIYNQDFQTCFDSQKYLPQIKKNFIDSEILGVSGTPTWFINGSKIEGALSVTDLEKIISPYLK